MVIGNIKANDKAARPWERKCTKDSRKIMGR
jgi:hypothetical protein